MVYNSLILNEYTRSQLINKSRQSSKYDRFARRTEIDYKEIDIGRVGLLELTASSLHLDIYFLIRDYRVSIRLVNFVTRLRLLINSKGYADFGRGLREAVLVAIEHSLANDDILVNCTCPDFYYRFSYTATVKGFGLETNQFIPATIRNPENKGSGCKHIMRVINVPSIWKARVVTAVSRAIEYDESILQ